MVDRRDVQLACAKKLLCADRYDLFIHLHRLQLKSDPERKCCLRKAVDRLA